MNAPPKASGPTASAAPAYSGCVSHLTSHGASSASAVASHADTPTT